jgi:hypothetical protein
MNALARLDQLAAEVEDTRQIYLSLNSTSAWDKYSRVLAIYENALNQAAPFLLAAAKALGNVTPNQPCWECGEYNACPPDCTHGQARIVLSDLNALEPFRAH